MSAIGVLLVALSALAAPLATTAVAGDPPPSSVPRESPGRDELARQQASAEAQRRQAQLDRDASMARDVAIQREIARQAERRHAETVDLERRTQQSVARAAVAPATTTSAVSLTTCNDATPREALVQAGASVQLIGNSWFTKTRGLAEAFIRGVTVDAAIDGVAIPHAERYFTAPVAVDHPTLGRVWLTRWEYSLAVSAPSIQVVVSFALDHQLVDLVAFDEDGMPVHYAAGFGATLRCTLRTAIAIGGRVTGAGAPLADAAVSAQDPATGRFIASARGDANGEFAMQLPPGSYRFSFRSLAGPWLPEWWDDAPTFGAAAIVTLAFGSTPPRLIVDLARGVFVTGAVTDAASHVGVAGVIVNAQTPGGACCFGSSSGTDGTYRFVAPMNVTLIVGFQPPTTDLPYLQQWWHARNAFQAADPLAIATADVSGIDAALERGVFVRGQVIDALTHAALANVSLSASANVGACCENFFASTDAAGRYAMAVRSFTPIVIGFFPPTNTTPYLPTYWNGKRSFQTADVLPVAAADVAGIDASIERGVYMRGRVTDATTSAGLERAVVIASVDGSPGESYFAFTAADGTYMSAVRGGVTLRVGFFPPGGTTYVSQYYHARASFSEADPVVVATSDLGGIDAALEHGVALRGRVTDARSGAPIPLAIVTASRLGVPCCENTGVTTDARGDYAIVVRPNIVVSLGFTPPIGSAYVAEWYNNKPSSGAADPIAVGTADIAHLDAALDRGVFVRGHVTDALTHAGIGGAGVTAYVGAAPCCSFLFASTNSDGSYALVVPASTLLKIFFGAPAGAQAYLSQWYRGRPTFDTAHILPVGDADLTGIDAALERGAFVRGHVTDASTHAAIAQVSVNAFVADACCENFFGLTDAAGAYAIAVRPNVHLKIGFFPPFGSDYVAEYFDDKPGFDSASIVPVVDTNVDGLDAALAHGVRLSGRVSETGGAAVANASVNIEDADTCCSFITGVGTSSDGTYSVSVRPGRYKVHVFGPFGSSLLAAYYHDQATWDTANVIVAVAAPIAGIDVSLEPGVTVSGRVTEAATGGPVQGVIVSIQTPTGQGIAFGVLTGVDGTYALVVAPGTYKVGFFPPDASLLRYQFWDDKLEFDVADELVVGPGGRIGIDAALAHP